MLRFRAVGYWGPSEVPAEQYLAKLVQDFLRLQEELRGPLSPRGRQLSERFHTVMLNELVALYAQYIGQGLSLDLFEPVLGDVRALYVARVRVQYRRAKR